MVKNTEDNTGGGARYYYSQEQKDHTVRLFDKGFRTIDQYGRKADKLYSNFIDGKEYTECKCGGTPHRYQDAILVHEGEGEWSNALIGQNRVDFARSW